MAPQPWKWVLTRVFPGIPATMPEDASTSTYQTSTKLENNRLDHWKSSHDNCSRIEKIKMNKILQLSDETFGEKAQTFSPVMNI